MKTMKFAKLLLPILCLSLAVLGCRKHPQGTTVLNKGPEGIAGTDIDHGGILPTNPPPAPLEGTPLPPSDKYKDWPENAEIFKADTVHFAFDSSVVKADEKPKAADVANYLKSNAGDALKIEGHCDERGTEEYNRSLGERRALALREELIQDGIDGGRITTISYGKDRPVDPGHNEAAWSQNRRGVFILLTPKTASP
jgi:peptidoglycan-associated lipoprotein